MPSWDQTLIAKILESRDLNSVIVKFGISDAHLKDPLASEIFKFILKHRTKHDELPSVALVTTKYKEYKHFSPEDSLDAICEQIVNNNFNTEFDYSLKKILSAADSDPQKALAMMERSSRELRTKWRFSSQDIDLASYTDFIREEYEKFKIKRGVTGLPYPWEYLSEETGGMNRQDLIVFYGMQKSGKSWILLIIASYLYKNMGKRILFATKEMSCLTLAIRASAIMAELPYGDFRKGKLTTDQEKKLLSMATDISSDGYFKITDGRTAHGGSVSVSSLMSKVEEYCPDILLVDGSYLMKDDRTNQRSIDHKNITNITQDLKELAQVKNIPVVISTQTNRYGDTNNINDDLAYSASFTADCDALFRMFRNKKTNELAILAKALREGEEKGLVINFNVANNFSLKNKGIPNLKSFIKADKEGASSQYNDVDTSDKDNLNNRFRSPDTRGRGQVSKFEDPGLPTI